MEDPRLLVTRVYSIGYKPGKGPVLYKASGLITKYRLKVCMASQPHPRVSDRRTLGFQLDAL